MKEVTMPKLSDTMTEGAVVAWRKAVGDQVERGEVIAEVETDKATMELEAFASGVLLEIRIDAGKTVPVGTVIGLIGGEGEQSEARVAVPSESSPKAEPETEVEVKAEPEAEPEAEPVSTVGSKAKIPAESAETTTADQVLAAPVVRQRAQELGIDLTAVTGSGPGGRILLEDLKPIAAGKSQAAKLEEASKTEEAPEKLSGQLPPQEALDTTPSAAQPLSRMRAAIARTVSDAWRTIPHFSVTVEVRMDAAEQLLRRLKDEGTSVSLTALLIQTTAQALHKFPRLNASLRDDKLISHAEINIGIVVRQGDGLLVPVLRNCAGTPLPEVARQATRLVERARHGQLSDTELSGGTFAISNLGMYGIDAFVALILPPMAAVLAVGAVRDGVVAEHGRPLVARLLTLTLSADHRLVDGAYAAEFMREVKQSLEAPAQLAITE